VFRFKLIVNKCLFIIYYFNPKSQLDGFTIFLYLSTTMSVPTWLGFKIEHDHPMMPGGLGQALTQQFS
jgi:hypothetical protein